ncbi:MAG: hypothetical protein BWY74_00813 [Firmicutes bacterium ADurb.Bin419]|nr:MAG: hypothetical protein BWY74_00813 [Firmicutes bacterium ADurb.Bin419]
MRLTNYKRGYEFDCVIGGVIRVSQPTFKKMVKYLLRTPKMRFDNGYWLRILREDLERKIKFKGGYWVNLRTTPTELIAKKWGLKNYQKRNYAFEVKTKK